MNNLLHELGTVVGITNFTKGRKLKYELIVKISAKNNKASRHEKYINQISLISRSIYPEQCITVLVLTILQMTANILKSVL